MGLASILVARLGQSDYPSRKPEAALESSLTQHLAPDSKVHAFAPYTICSFHCVHLLALQNVAMTVLPTERDVMRLRGSTDRGALAQLLGNCKSSD